MESGRRLFIKKATLFSTVVASGLLTGIPFSAGADSGLLSKEERDELSPDEVIARIKSGNDRFRKGEKLEHDFLSQKRSSRNGQYPIAVILGCIDSRTPAEIITDTGIGELFNCRVAGNIENEDILGSLEFSCALSGAKIVMVMGHTKCGAIKGAASDAKLGNLTSLLEKIKPAIEKTDYSGEKDVNDYQYIDAIAKTNVQLTIENIRKKSQVLASLEKDGKIKIVGTMYHLEGGRLEFL
ncbi:carbonic anhydrase family protein [Erwinia psidii]|uniref:Carbonic anhydrase n=1 Tax=Erwinia psidii TaxID=69224 RepID=A0A3N6V147_9GAMM|nr:carbonic anhydrase family protein [Erwinia psidii]MCX8955970.1 carbonic anhydrase [Erwinia psidii]MCX8963812.1 carbonic anhydrase [Erwinia psidii]RQM38795.1 carbonic anhydrase [Erwinia psidii]